MSDELPQGWAETTVGEVAEDISYGFTAKATTEPVGPRLLRITDIQNGSVQWESVPYCEIPRGRAANYSLRSGDIVFARTGATTGKSFRIRSCPEAVFASYLIRVRPSQSTLPEFLAHFFQSASYWNQISENLSGSAQPNCNASKLATISLPLAPLAEQRRIVAKLETLLGKVDASQQRLAKIPVLLKRFRQSVLAAACSGRLTADWREENLDVEPASEILSRISREKEKVKLRKPKKNTDAEELDVPFDVPSTWALCFFDDLAAAKPNAIKAGPFGSSLTKACYVPNGFKVYGQEQVINGDPNFGDYYISEEKFKELQSCEVCAGDILVSLVGTIGKVLVIPKQFQPGIINPRLAKFSLHPSIVREYIANYLLSTLAKNIMSQQSHGGTMEILNLGIMRKLPIPLAPLPEQQEIVRRVEGLFALADQLEVRLAKARGQVDALTPSLLARAFAGQLVPQDPTDEPAEKMLARIHPAAKS